jgi:hypothetical protein
MHAGQSDIFRNREDMMRIATAFLTIVLAATTALAQQAVPPPPQPAPDKPVATIPPTANTPPAASGPTLDVTLKFIQDKVNEQGKIVYVESESNSLTGERVDDNSSLEMKRRAASSKMASPSLARSGSKKGWAGAGGGTSPELFAETEAVAYDPAGALSLKEEGTKTEVQRAGLGVMIPVTENWTKTWAVNFKNVEKLEVLSSADYKHRVDPAKTFQDDPAYFELVIHMAPGKSVTRHIETVPSNRRGKPTELDESIKEFALHFRDEDATNRVAKAMIHAIELCGGGSTPEPF